MFSFNFIFYVLVFVRQKKFQTIILSSDEEDNDNTKPPLNGDVSHLIEEVTIKSLFLSPSLTYHCIILICLIKLEFEDTAGDHNVSSDDSSDHAPNKVNGSMKSFNNFGQSTSNEEYLKITSVKSISDKLKATPPPPVAMPSRKRLQPQTKSKFKYNTLNLMI